MSACIDQIEYYLPKTVLSNRDLEKQFTDWDGKRAEKRIGIRNRHIASEGETALDLACYACEKLFQFVDKNKIDFILFCTQSPDYFLPPDSCILQDRLHMKTNIGALDLNLGCSGYIYGLGIAQSLILNNLASHVLFVTSDTYSKYIHPEDKSNRTVFGDGAAASLISKSKKEKIHKFSFGTDGQGYNNLIVPNGGLRHRFSSDAPIIEDAMGSKRTKNNLYMSGPEIFNFTIEAVPEVFNDVLLKNKMTLNDVDHIFFHQANKYMLNYLRKKINIPEEKFYINLLETGNTVSSTIPIALKDALSKGLIGKGKIVMLVGFGVGYSWGGTIVEI